MKNTPLKYLALIKETGLLLMLFLVAFSYNIYSLVQINEEWQTVFSQLDIVAGLSVILYFIIGMVRLTIRFFQKSVKNYQDYNKPEDF